MKENSKCVLILRGIVRKKTAENKPDGFVLELYDEDVILRREGGEHFTDEFFEDYTGKRIEVNGYRVASDFFVLMLNGKEI